MPGTLSHLGVLVLLARVRRRLRVGRAARDRLALEVVGVVDVLAADLHRAVRLVLDVGGAELGRRPLVVARLAVRAAVRLVLGLAARPVLQLLRRVALLELGHLLLGLLDLALVVLGLVGGSLLLSHPLAIPRAAARETAAGTTSDDVL